MPSVYIKTFGCQMNEQDSVMMAGLLERHGFHRAERPEGSDLILINTCHIREKATQKAMSEIGKQNHRRLEREGKKALIGVVGCVASIEGEKLLQRFREIDFVVGTDQIHQLPEIVKSTQAGAKRAARSAFQDISDYEFPATPDWMSSEKKVKAYVTIMKGCDNTCAFCVVPMTRGAEVSRTPDDILEEIHRLEENGVKEVMLLGQNVNSYGKRLLDKTTFAQLLRRIDEETKISRLRFTSPHPKDLSVELVEEYGKSRSLCPQLHLPIQSGSNRILKKMRRAYTREVYLKKVERLRKIRPDVALTTDLIVGFPGETEEDFCKTLDLVREAQFDQSYTFEYSTRPGTEAALLKETVPVSLKRERLKRLQDLQAAVSEQKNRERIGLIEEVLVEGESAAGGGQMTGRSAHGRIVNFDGRREQIGAILRVKVESVSPFSMKGNVIYGNG